MRRFAALLCLAIAVVSTACGKRYTSLTEAAGHGDVDEVSRLLSNGADPNAPNTFQETPLEGAVSLPNNTEVIALLLRHGAKMELPSRASVLGDAHETNIAQLLEAGADVNWGPPGRRTPLQAIVWTRQYATVRTFIARGANVNPPGLPLIALATDVGDAKMARLLLQAGAKPTSERRTSPLAGVLKYQDDALLLELLQAGADATWVDATGENLLMIAIRWHCSDFFIDKLIEFGADPNLPAQSGLTPLQLARQLYPGSPVERALISHGARQLGR